MVMLGQKNLRQQMSIEQISDPAEPKKTSPFRGVVHFGWDSVYIVIGMIGAAGAALIPIVLLIVFGTIIEALSAAPAVVMSTSEIVVQANNIRSRAQTTTQLDAVVLYVILVAVGALVVYTIWYGSMTVAHGRIGYRLKIKYLSSLLDQEIGYYDMKRTGQLLNDLSESMELIQDTYTTKIGDLIYNSAQVIFALIFALIKGWEMSLVILSVVPLFMAISIASIALIGIIQRNINRIVGTAAGMSNEVVSAIRTVRSMDGEENEKKKFENQLFKNNKWIFSKSAVQGLGMGLSMGITWAVVALGFWYGSGLLLDGKIEFASMSQVLLYLLLGYMCLTQCLNILSTFGKSDQAMISLLKVIRRVPVMNPRGGIQPEAIVGNIEFKNVFFSYPTRPNIQVLKDFNLMIQAGQSVALVGSSGSGKSTIIGLLEKFYSPDSGDILLDGTKLSDIDPSWLHRNVGIVTQEPTLFAATIRDNILYAVKQSGRAVTEEEVINAAKAANAHDFITSLPSGYDTMLGEKGVSMSGGQKQRIAIARAMIQDPKVLLLDEATSALDTQSESIVQEALDKLMIGRTCIIIAHRLSTVIDCDVICVMNKGKLREKGTHAELMKIENGHYFNLAARQMLGVTHVDIASDSDSDSAHLIDIPPEL